MRSAISRTISLNGRRRSCVIFSSRSGSPAARSGADHERPPGDHVDRVSALQTLVSDLVAGVPETLGCRFETRGGGLRWIKSVAVIEGLATTSVATSAASGAMPMKAQSIATVSTSPCTVRLMRFARERVEVTQGQRKAIERARPALALAQQRPQI